MQEVPRIAAYRGVNRRLLRRVREDTCTHITRHIDGECPVIAVAPSNSNGESAH